LPAPQKRTKNIFYHSAKINCFDASENSKRLKTFEQSQQADQPSIRIILHTGFDDFPLKMGFEITRFQGLHSFFSFPIN
jgi:hypothetical protein